MLVVAGLASAWPHEKSRRFLAAAVAGVASYVTFMVSFDVPMYLSRWQADRAAGRQYLAREYATDLARHSRREEGHRP